MNQEAEVDLVGEEVGEGEVEIEEGEAEGGAVEVCTLKKYILSIY